MYEDLTLTKEYLEEADLYTYTIELPDGQSITLSQYEFETLKSKIELL